MVRPTRASSARYWSPSTSDSAGPDPVTLPFRAAKWRYRSASARCGREQALDLLPHPFPELLPHAWHGEEDGGAARLKVFLDRRQALGEPRLASGQHLAEVADRALGDVRQRQEGQEAVVGPDGHDPGDAVDVGDDVAVGEHGALGAACRARRVDDGGQVVRVDGVGVVLEHGRVQCQFLGGEGLEVTQIPDEVVVEAVTPVEHEHPLELRQLLAAEQHLGELVQALDEEEAAAGVAEDVGDLAGGVGGIDRHRDATGGQDAEVGQVPLRAGCPRARPRGHPPGVRGGSARQRRGRPPWRRRPTSWSPTRGRPGGAAWDGARRGAVVPEDLDDCASRVVIGHKVTLPSCGARGLGRWSSPPGTEVGGGALASAPVANHKKTAEARKPQHHLPKVGSSPADNAYRQKRSRQDVVDFGVNRGRGGSPWALIIGIVVVAALVIGVIGLIVFT